MNDNDEPGFAPVLGDMRASSEDDEFWWKNAVLLTGLDWKDGSSPAPRTLRLNICIVPLSLETASHWTFKERAILYISALSTPLRTYMEHVILTNLTPEHCYPARLKADYKYEVSYE